MERLPHEPGAGPETTERLAGRLLVITTPDRAPGFRLAGVETLAVASPAEAQTLLQELLERGDASLIAVRQSLLQGLDARLQRRLDASYRPLVLALPEGLPQRPGDARRQRLTELIRQAVGFHLTFGGPTPPTSPAT